MISWVPIASTAIFFFSIAALFVSVLWAWVMTGILTVFDHGRPSTAFVFPSLHTRLPRANEPLWYSTVYFYAGTMPFVTSMWASQGFTPNPWTIAPSIQGLVCGVLILCCWIIQLSSWMSCQVTPVTQGSFTGYGWCPNAGIPSHVDVMSISRGRLPYINYGFLISVRNRLAEVQSILEIFITTGTLSLAYVILAGAVLARNRKARESGLVVVDEDAALDSMWTSSEKASKTIAESIG